VVEALLLASLGSDALAAASTAAAAPAATAPAAAAAADDPLKPYRLAVKRRILATDADIAAVADVDSRKALLEDAYQAAVAAYLRALAAARLVPRHLADAAAAGFAAREARREVELAAEAAAAAEAAGGEQ
jgi:predicted methyltransferase MtxX (methanogen marker protein 4)